jgi:hypothetical protein
MPAKGGNIWPVTMETLKNRVATICRYAWPFILDRRNDLPI